jgi:hypothetical protein
MRGVLLLLISFFLFSLGTGALAQETEILDPGLPAVDLAKAGLTPDSFFSLFSFDWFNSGF